MQSRRGSCALEAKVEIMKLREVFYSLGLKPRPKKYGYEVHEQVIDGKNLRYAQWLHPRAYSGAVLPAEVERLQAFLRPGDVAIDIGAHMGDSTLPMALAVGKSGTVIAFEANSYVFETLSANANLNPHIGKIYAYNLAVTEESRMYEFSYNDPGFMNGGAVEKTRGFRRGDAFRQMVKGIRLTDFLNQNFPELVSKVRYIKIDTEGCDLYILKSISSLLTQVHPVVQTEVMRRTPAEYRFAMYDFLVEHGYKVHHHVSSESQVEVMEREQMLEGDNFDLFCIHKSDAVNLRQLKAAA